MRHGITAGIEGAPCRSSPIDNSGLSPYKNPQRIVFLPEPPETVTGKIQRFAVRVPCAQAMSSRERSQQAMALTAIMLVG
jgi:hypothetical protein